MTQDDWGFLMLCRRLVLTTLVVTTRWHWQWKWWRWWKIVITTRWTRRGIIVITIRQTRRGIIVITNQQWKIVITTEVRRWWRKHSLIIIHPFLCILHEVMESL